MATVFLGEDETDATTERDTVAGSGQDSAAAGRSEPDADADETTPAHVLGDVDVIL